MFPLTPDQHHWLEVATEDEGLLTPRQECLQVSRSKVKVTWLITLHNNTSFRTTIAFNSHSLGGDTSTITLPPRFIVIRYSLGGNTDKSNTEWVRTLWVHSSYYYAYIFKVKKILTASAPEDWKRPPGRPQITWMKTVLNDLDNLTLTEVGSESPTLEVAGCDWRYALLVVQARNDDDVAKCCRGSGTIQESNVTCLQ